MSGLLMSRLHLEGGLEIRVKSPWILGKENPLKPSPEITQISEELGIEIIDE